MRETKEVSQHAMLGLAEGADGTALGMDGSITVRCRVPSASDPVGTRAVGYPRVTSLVEDPGIATARSPLSRG